MQKQKVTYQKKLKQSPTLNTILMVEETLENMPGSVMTIPELKRALPKQVNHNVLITILEYLERDRKIVVGMKGITWIRNDHPNIQKLIREGKRI